MKILFNKFAILHLKDIKKKEIIYLPIIYENVDAKNIYTYLNFQLTDTEDKFINIVKQQLRIDDSEVDRLKKEFLNFKNNSTKIDFYLVDTFTINQIIFYIAVNKSHLKAFVFTQPESFSRREKSKNRFYRRWVLRDLELISADLLDDFEKDLPRIYSIKRTIFNQVYIDKFNNTMGRTLRKIGP